MEEKNLRHKLMLFSMVLFSLLALACFMIPAKAQSGPKTGTLTITLFANNAMLPPGIIDIIGWPLDSTTIGTWAGMPATIQMREYVGMDMYEIDMNNQRWPLGVKDRNVTLEDISTDIRYNQSRDFRKAVAHLTDRDTIVSTDLSGYGYRLDLPMVPFQSDYMDMPLYHALGLIYHFNTTRAAEFLDGAGFVDTDLDGIRNDPKTGNNLSPLKFYTRTDPFISAAATRLATALGGVGVPVTLFTVARTVCYKQVMILYDYDLYAGGWLLGTVPDQYYDLYSSHMYWGQDFGWSLNYPGFCNHEFDVLAEQVKYPATLNGARVAAKAAGKVFLQNCPTIPLWSSAGVKAYRTGWTGVVNNGGYGVDNYYAFLNMFHPTDTTIDWGVRTDIASLNVITSGTMQFSPVSTSDLITVDSRILGLIYDSLLGKNPFNLVPEHLIAESYSVDSWDATSYGGDPAATKVTFKIRNNVFWHRSGPQLAIEDVSFSFNYTYDCGPGVAWNYASLSEMARDKTHIVNSTAIEIYFKRQSAWAVQWAGGIPIIRKSIWENVPLGKVRSYDPTVQDADGNLVIDLIEDGTGPWEFSAYTFGTSVTLTAFPTYCLSQAYINARLVHMFHYGAGDVDESGVVSLRDIGFMVRALGTNSTHWPPGTGWDQYNWECDLNQDGDIDGQDLIVVTTNYGKTQG